MSTQRRRAKVLGEEGGVRERAAGFFESADEVKLHVGTGEPSLGDFDEEHHAANARIAGAGK